MQLTGHPSRLKKLRKPLLIAAGSIVAITVLVIIFYFIAQPYIKLQLGPTTDKTSSKIIYKIPSRLEQDKVVAARMFGATSGKEAESHTTAWSWRDQTRTDVSDGLLFATGYSYVNATGGLPPDRAGVISQLKQSSQLSIANKVKTLADCKETPTIKVYDFNPVGARGFYYDYACTDMREHKVHGLVGFILVDDSTELHLFTILASEDIWQANRSRITTMLGDIRVQK